MRADISDQEQGWLGILAAFPFLYVAFCVACGLAVAAIKWVVAGRYKATTAPLWSTFVWRLEWVTGLYESPAVHFLVAMLTGTPFIAWIHPGAHVVPPGAPEVLVKFFKEHPAK